MKDKKKLKISLNKVKTSIRNLTKKQRILYVTSLLVLCVITLIFGMYSNFNKRVDNTKLENNVEKKGLSMMLETKPHSGVYEMAVRDKWPTSGYLFNETLSKCENGGTLEWDDVNKTIKTHVTGSDKCYVYFDVEPPDVYIATSNLPSTYGAKGNISCISNGATYNQKYNRVEISNIYTKYEDCSLTYTEQTSKTYLNDYIMGLAGTEQGDGQVVSETVNVPDYSTTSAISEASYTSQSTFLNNDPSSNYGSNVSGIYSFADSEWTSDVTAMVPSNSYHFRFTPSESGYYQMCYELSSGNPSNKLYVYVGSTYKYINGSYYLSASSTVSKTGCVELGYISNGKYINITQLVYNKIATLSFSIKRVGTTNTSNDFRYEGKNPNNYIWFNNELWRIIGVFDENSHSQSGTNLVKIMRENSIGGLVWDKSRTNNWTTASLNSLLNGAYLNAQDGTDSGDCYISLSVQGNCDYRRNGIQDRYRVMIQNVTWYLGGHSGEYESAEAFYGYERGYERETTVYGDNPTRTTGYIGLMYPSDYGYSVLSSSCARTTNLGSYNSSSCGGQSWISGNNYEWLMSSNTEYSYSVFSIGSYANLGHCSVYANLSTRPVLYLKSDVYYVDGDGNVEDPIIIGE